MLNEVKHLAMSEYVAKLFGSARPDASLSLSMTPLITVDC